MTAPKPRQKREARKLKSSAYFPLFEHMSREHGLTLLDSEMDEIVRVVRKMTSPGVWVTPRRREPRPRTPTSSKPPASYLASPATMNFEPYIPDKVDVGPSPRLGIIPVSLADANQFVKQHHRHHKPVTGHKFSIAVSDGSAIRGVAIVGRPVSRMEDDGWTLEVNRCCTDGAQNGCSMLYRSAWRAALAIGYRRLITYTLGNEGGASLRGSGFKLLGKAGGGSWGRKSRPRIDDHPTQEKLKWEMV